MNITENQRKLLQHMLGADSRYLKKDWGFRNHFSPDSNPNHEDRRDLMAMTWDGLVKSSNTHSLVFWATRKGALAIGFKDYQLKKAKL